MKNSQADTENIVSKASNFARAAHARMDQRRRYTGDPYIVHPAAVAATVTTVTADQAIICAAWLHDVVEDTDVTITQIESEFGLEVANLVSDLTDVSCAADGNREARKRKDLEHTQAASARARLVKLADLIDNASSIITNDPGFARVYMAEMAQLLPVLADADATLHARARQIVDSYFAQTR